MDEPSMLLKKWEKSGICASASELHYVKKKKRQASKMAKIIYLSEFLDDKRMITDERILCQWNSYS